VFLARKSNFSTRKQLFHVHNLSSRSNVLAKFFQPRNRDSPFSIQGCAKPHFHMGIPVWKQGLVYFKSLYGNGDSPFSYGDVPIPVFISGSPYGNVFGSQNFWQCDGARCVTQWPAKTTVPVSIRGVPTWKHAGRLRNSHLGTPCYQAEFVTIRGLTYMCGNSG
jgi:hypothetical protein